MRLTLSAPAKINLTLGITGLRSDGYHLLESIMQTVSLADTLIFEKIPAGILLSCNKSHIPTDERNLCCKAAKKYFDAAGISGGIKIDLIKCIPDGAGMGGGSSDAAQVLKAMQVFYPAEVDLLEIAASLGADVPFFLEGGTVLCSGIGEVLEPLSLPQKNALFCVVTKPTEGLYISNDLWREMDDFVPGTVLLVLASDYYDEADYIRNYEDFLKYIKE